VLEQLSGTCLLVSSALVDRQRLVKQGKRPINPPLRALAHWSTATFRLAVLVKAEAPYVCAAPPKAPSKSSSQMPLSCPDLRPH